MPLIKGKSKASFVKNLKTEMEHGKPQKQALAIAYAMKRKKKAYGGMYAEGEEVQPEPSPAPQSPVDPDKAKAFSASFNRGKKYAKGGDVKGVHGEFAGKGSGMSHAGMKAAIAYGDKHDPVRGDNDKKFQKRVMGESKSEHERVLSELKEMPNPKLKGLAHGGFIAQEKAHGYLPMPEEHEMENAPAHEEDDEEFNQHMPDMQQETSVAEQDLVDRIMMARSKDFSHEARLAMGGYLEDGHMYPHAKGKMFDVTNKYSEGGKVANQEHGYNNNELAGFSPNEFDDLVLRDELESTYGDDDNAGDELGNAGEDERRHDIVARIMASRRKKDKLPNPR